MVPKSWPIPRKGTAYVIKNNSKGIPILVVLRDMLGFAQNRKEVKRAIHEKNLLICGKIVDDEKRSVELFDVLTIIPSKKNYRLELSGKGKFVLNEVKDKEKDKKISKVIGRKILKDKKIQVNLNDGRNFLTDIKCVVNDSLSVNLAKNKVEKCLELKEGKEVLVIGGKHSGYVGKIKRIIPELKMVELDSKEKPSRSERSFRALIKQIMVVN